ncbi:MAG: glycosyltransferase family 2 protein [Alphaproteobacteria bacterium]|nr:glycosyltransferase family 2 protein [Alphaproteobacteria bacterium]
MTLKDKLQIILITYNREAYLKQTLQQLFSSTSPIKECDITILDNASTDGSTELIDNYCHKFKNLTHIRHHVNIGGNANICRAFEIGYSCGKEYTWVLCDDDTYDFSFFPAIKKAIISNKFDIIYTNRCLNIEAPQISKGYLAFTAAFLPGCIYKTKCISSDIIQNMYGTIHTWYPQSILSLDILYNKNGRYYFPDGNLIIRGNITDANKNVASLTRGIHLLHPDLQRMFWHIGFIKVAQIITNPKIRTEVIETANFNECYNETFYDYLYSIINYNICWKENSLKNIMDVLCNLNIKQRFLFIKAYCIYFTKKFLSKVFSLKNTPDKQHKVITFLGLKLKIKHKPRKKG